MSGLQASDDRPSLGPDTVLFGIGNSGRSDDGLGWAFLDAVQQLPAFNACAEYRYQLQVEDALLASRMTRVIFIDSSRNELPGGFEWKPCTAAEDFEFTTHVLPPRAIMHYCRELYGKAPRADILGIQGYCWDLHIGLSAAAEANLARALAFFTS